MGTTKRPVYRLVVADSRSPRDGRFIEAIGFYDPLPNPSVFRVDEEKVRVWMRRGARPSDSARELLVRQGILTAPPRPVRTPKVSGSSEPAGAASAPPASPATATPASLSSDAAEDAAASAATEAADTASVAPASDATEDPA
jgi:small subunit ribosomal protein S16